MGSKRKRRVDSPFFSSTTISLPTSVLKKEKKSIRRSATQQAVHGQSPLTASREGRITRGLEPRGSAWREFSTQKELFGGVGVLASFGECNFF